MNIKLGCDPELFLMDVTGKLRASCGLIGGTKEKPQPLPLGEGYAVQEDNVAIEFNIPPASNAREFVESIQKTLKFLGDGVKDAYGFNIVNLSAASFPKDELTSEAAQVFGCDPDYNAWTLDKNPRPKAADETLRSCGGHVHVGLGKEHQDVDPIWLIRCMDLFLGVPSVLMDKGDLRKQLYGKAGAYRAKSYGVEYRTLSNFWVFNEAHTDWVFRNTVRAVNAVKSRFTTDEFRADTIRAINSNDKEIAEKLCSKYELEVIHA